jgi:hypothetical protein
MISELIIVMTFLSRLIMLTGFSIAFCIRWFWNLA